MAVGLDVLTLLALFGVSVVAACIDAIAGGGGLLTVPALIVAGLDPVSAVATNKLQGTFGTVSAVWNFGRRGLIDWRLAAPTALVAVAFGIAGALSVRLLPQTALAVGVPILLVAVALYFALRRGLTETDVTARMPTGLFTAAIVPLVAFYDGIFGPGAGAFYTVGFVTLLGYGIVKATAQAKLANASSNLGGLALFALTGAVVWPVGLVMAAGAVLGARIGSALALRLGARLIRPLLVTISSAMAIRLLADPANPLRSAVAAWWR